MRPTVIALALLAGCVDVTRPVARRTVPAVGRERALTEATERTRRAGLPRLPDDQRREARIVAREDAVQHAVVGPLRYDLTGGVATAADDVTAHPIALARRATRGWVFVTDRDEVYVSETFLGRLRALRSFGCDAPRVRATEAQQDATMAALTGMARPLHGRAVEGSTEALPVTWRGRGRVAFSIRGRVLWSDGASLRAVDVPGVVALAWRDDAHAAMIVGYRALRATSDGGATWRDIALGEAAPLDLSGEDGTLTVTTSAGRRVVRDDGGLADAPPPDPPAPAPCQRLEAIGPATLALFERGYARVAAARAECADPPTEVYWEMARIVAHLPRAGGEDEMPMWSVPRGRPAPLGTLRSRAFLNTGSVPAVVSATRPDDPPQGHPITLAWRGEDERGPFSVRVATRAPREIPVAAAWRLVAATRAGILVEAPAWPEGANLDSANFDGAHGAPDLFWFSAAGVRRLHVALDGEHHPVGVALGDGGAVLLSRDQPTSRDDDCERRRVVAPPGSSFALRIDASGTVIARRDVVTGETFQPLIGLGQRGERWGVVVDAGASLTLLPLDGGSVPFGPWGVGDTPAVCRAAATDRLHLLGGLSGDEYEVGGLPVTIGPQGDGPDFADARLVTLERTGERVCVRRIWGVQRLDGGGDEDVGELYGAARFTARGGRLTGSFDDGRHLATVSVSLSDRIGFMQDI